MKYVFELNENPENVNFPVKVFHISDSGMKAPARLMTLSDTAKIFSAEMEMENDFTDLNIQNVTAKISASTPMLPSNCVSYGSGSDKFGVYEQVAVSFPKGIYPLNYMGTEIKMVGFPKLLFIFSFLVTAGNRRLENSKVFALEDKPFVNEDDKLFNFPFTNVQKSSGDICWGNMLLGFKFNSLQDIDKLVQMFINGAFNEDYSISLNPSYMATLAPDVSTLGAYIEKFEEVEFSNKLLVENHNKKVKSILVEKNYHE